MGKTNSALALMNKKFRMIHRLLSLANVMPFGRVTMHSLYLTSKIDLRLTLDYTDPKLAQQTIELRHQCSSVGTPAPAGTYLLVAYCIIINLFDYQNARHHI